MVLVLANGGGGGSNRRVRSFVVHRWAAMLAKAFHVWRFWRGHWVVLIFRRWANWVRLEEVRACVHVCVRVCVCACVRACLPCGPHFL